MLLFFRYLKLTLGPSSSYSLQTIKSLEVFCWLWVRPQTTLANLLTVQCLMLTCWIPLWQGSSVILFPLCSCLAHCQELCVVTCCHYFQRIPHCPFWQDSTEYGKVVFSVFPALHYIQFSKFWQWPVLTFSSIAILNLDKYRTLT